MTDPISQLTTVPFLRKLWVVVLLTCLPPVAMVILLSGPVYRWRDQGWRPISNGARYTYGGLLALWLVAATARAVLQPGGISGEWAKSADPEIATNAQPKSEVPPGGAMKADDYSEPKNPEPTSAKTPDMNVSVGGQYNDITITADDDVPFSIERVVLNDRQGDDKCDFRPFTITEDMTPDEKYIANLQTKLPTSNLRRGDSIKVSSSCGETLRVTVYTNHGVSQYLIKQQ